MKAIVAARRGGPEVLEPRDVPEPEAAQDTVLVRVRSAGVNFADTMATAGTYHSAPPPPFIPGLEVAGEEVGSGRPVIALVRSGGYAEKVAADSRLVFAADGVDLDEAGGWPLVTLTSWLALTEVARLRPGETVLVTAGAGGLGSTAIQVARALKAGRVVALASTEEKRAFARSAGADEAFAYDEELPPVDVVVDGVGGPVAARALDAVRPLGRMAMLGMASGEAPTIPGFEELRRRNVGIFPFSFGQLRGADPARTAELARGGIDLLRQGKVRPRIGRSLPLAQAAEAHRLLLSRESKGKLVLRPGS